MAALGIIRPAAGQLQRPIDEGRPFRRCVHEQDADLGVGGAADRAGILPRDAAGPVPLLNEAGVIKDQDPAGWIAQMIDHRGPEVVPYSLRIPDGRTQEALHAPWLALADGFGSASGGPTVLALHSAKQRRQIAPDALADLSPSEAVRDPGVQVGQRLGPTGEGASSTIVIRAAQNVSPLLPQESSAEEAMCRCRVPF